MTEDFEFDEFDEEEDEEDFPESIRAKWSMDGATTLTEAAECLRQYADYLVGREKEGWQLIEPIDDDWGFIQQTVDETN